MRFPRKKKGLRAGKKCSCMFAQKMKVVVAVAAVAAALIKGSPVLY